MDELRAIRIRKPSRGANRTYQRIGGAKAVVSALDTLSDEIGRIATSGARDDPIRVGTVS